MASEPMICCSWVTKGRVMRPGIDRIDGVPPAVGGEIVAGQGVHPGRRVGLVQRGGGLADVEGGRRRLGEAVGDDGPGPQGHGRTGHGGHRERTDDQSGLAHPGGHGADPGAEEHGQSEDDQGRGPVGRAQGQPGRGVHQERLDGRAHLRRIGIGVGPDGQHHAHHGDQHEVGPVPPPGEGGGDEAQHRHGEAGADQPQVLGVGHRRLGPGPQPVRPVEVPVAQSPDDLRGQRGPAGGRHRLGVLEDVDPVGRLHLEPDGPPQRDQHTEQADLPGRPPRLAPGGLAGHDDGVGQPQGRRDAHEEDRTGVDPADQGHHQGEQGRVPPAPHPQGEDDEGHHPGQARPRQQDHRDPSRVLQDIRGEHEPDGGHVPAGSGEADGPAQVEGAGSGREQQGGPSTGAGRSTAARGARPWPSRRGPSAGGSRCSGGSPSRGPPRGPTQTPPPGRSGPDRGRGRSWCRR